jgi:hypothetical protein
MAHTRNAPLAARIADLGLTEHEVSDLLNDAIERATGRRGRSTDRYVRLLLDGTIRWPWPVNRRALEQVLDLPILELGFVPRGRSSVIAPHRAKGRTALARLGPVNEKGPDRPGPDRPGTEHPRPDRPGTATDHAAQEATMERREVLGIAAGATVSIVVPALPERGRIGMGDVARLRAPLDELVAIDQRLGGVAMAPVCVRQAERVLDAIRRLDTSDRVERALYGLAGEYLAAAGWACVDALDLAEASGILDRAMHAANTAQDPMVQAKVTNLLVMRAREAGDHGYALAMSKSGVICTASRANPRVNALFHARTAHGHAYRGELGMAQRALGRARDALANVTPDTPTPPWLRFFDSAELAALAALSYHRLGRYREASQQGGIAVAEVRPGYVRNQTLYTLALADSVLSEREVEQAAAQATAGLELAGQLRDGLYRGRVGRRLYQLRGRFAQWPDVPDARTWVAAYDRTRHPRPGVGPVSLAAG